MTRKLLLIVSFLIAVPAPSFAQNSKTIYEQARREPRGSARAVELYQRYVRMEPDDAWGHLALAEAFAARRNFDEAFAALKRAEQLAPGEEDVAVVRTRINRLHRAALPSVKPTIYMSRDTDENTSLTYGGAGDVALSTAARFGVSASRTNTSDGFVDATTDRGLVTLAMRARAVRWNSEVGVARIAHDSARNLIVGQTHLRVSGGPNSFTADVRVRRTPVTSVYSLVASEMLLTEARGSVDVPIGGPVKLRGLGQIGSIETSERNQRIGLGGALVRSLSATSEVSLLGYRLSYESAGTGQYFAPEYVGLVELGTYTEIYKFDPLTIAFDAGAGVQRAKIFNEDAGEFTPSFRVWAQASLPVARYVELSAELDYYKSQLSTVTTSASWSSLAGGLSLRWLIN